MEQIKHNHKWLIVCSNCKKQIQESSVGYRKHIEQYGSEENLKHYLCRKCRPKKGYHAYLVNLKEHVKEQLTEIQEMVVMEDLLYGG